MIELLGILGFLISIPSAMLIVLFRSIKLKEAKEKTAETGLRMSKPLAFTLH